MSPTRLFLHPSSPLDRWERTEPVKSNPPALDFTFLPLSFIFLPLSFCCHNSALPCDLSSSTALSSPQITWLTFTSSCVVMAEKWVCFPALLMSFMVLPSFSTNSEGNALCALKRKLSDPRKVLQSWDPTLVNPCTWFHVTCDSENHVIRLDLGNANISGHLGPELGQLEHLQYLELYGNDIGGKLPEELGNLKNLISFDLYDNKLEGEIPKTFGGLKSLRFLRLNNNKLIGPIPRELSNLSNLKVLDLSNNDLCGTIPTRGPFRQFSPLSFEGNKRLNGPELQGLVSYDFGC